MALGPDEIERVLFIAAHPDDAEFWAGGTIASWTKSGVTVTYAVLTDGEAGGSDVRLAPGEIAAMRRAEQEQAASILGVSRVRFLGRGEGDLDRGDLQLRRELVRIIRQDRPQVVVTWTPEWNWQRFRSCHPAHRATGEIALSAIYPDAGNPLGHRALLTEEGLDPWVVREAWLINSPSPDHYVDITEMFERKVAAVQAHHSQTKHRDSLAEYLRDRIASNTKAAGLPDARLAEAFQAVVTE